MIQVSVEVKGMYFYNRYEREKFIEDASQIEVVDECYNKCRKTHCFSCGI